MTPLFMTKLPYWPISLRMPHIILIPLTLVLLSMGLKPAFAEEPKKKVDWYQVEVIIFSQQDLFNEEKHKKDIELAFPENIRLLQNSDTELKTETQLTSTEQHPYLVLPENLMAMVPDRNRLRRAPGYRVLFHKAWRQPGLGRTESSWIFIQGGNKTNSRHELEGSFRLVRNRYLHVQANLWKTKFSATGTQFAQPVTLPSGTGQLQWPLLPSLPAFNSEGEYSDTKDTKDEKELAIERKTQTKSTPATSDIVILNQSTRVTRNELTYLDHPNMGAIVLVTKYKPEKGNKD